MCISRILGGTFGLLAPTPFKGEVAGLSVQRIHAVLHSRLATLVSNFPTTITRLTRRFT